MNMLKWLGRDKKTFDRYLKWRSDPFTQELIIQMRLDITPPSMPAAIVNANGFAIYCLGSIGAQMAQLDRLLNLDQEVESAREQPAELDERTIQYLMQFEGRTREDAIRIVGELPVPKKKKPPEGE
jgi:hypothetical protein